jgi:alkyl hydroperoxide reductase subunit AhpC
MSAHIGAVAPTRRLEAWVRGTPAARRISLADYRGQWVVLVFYPRDFTFVCPTELQSLAGLHEEFASEDAVVLAASTDSYHSHKAWFEGDLRLHAVTFPVIADTAHELAKAFGVLLDDGTALRGTFILDPWGVVRHVLVNDLDVGRNIDETLRTLRALKTGERCPVSWAPGDSTLGVPEETAA